MKRKSYFQLRYIAITILLLLLHLPLLSLSAQRRYHQPRVKVQRVSVEKVAESITVPISDMSMADIETMEENDQPEFDKVDMMLKETEMVQVDKEPVERLVEPNGITNMKTKPISVSKRKIEIRKEGREWKKGNKKEKKVIRGVYLVLLIFFITLTVVGLILFPLGVAACVPAAMVETMVGFGAAFIGIGPLGSMVVLLIAFINYLVTCGYQNGFEM